MNSATSQTPRFMNCNRTAARVFPAMLWMFAALAGCLGDASSEEQRVCLEPETLMCAAPKPLTDFCVRPGALCEIPAGAGMPPFSCVRGERDQIALCGCERHEPSGHYVWSCGDQ